VSRSRLIPAAPAARCSLVSFLLVTILSVGAGAQQAPPVDLLTRIKGLGITTSTNRITVYYESPYEDRALRLRTLIEDARQFFADSLGVAPELSLAVLTRPLWDRVITWQPYGIPGVEGRPPVAFLPATDDNLAAQDALDLAPGVSRGTHQMLADAGLDWPTASRRYVDLVGLHELGHAFAQAAGISVGARWLNEWVATYFAYTYLRAARPQDARMWEGVLQGYRDAVQPTHRTLESFERLYFGVGARNYVWYQAQFQRLVAEVHATHGVNFVRRLKEAFREGGGAATMTPKELLRRLDALHPEFEEWERTMR